MRSPVLSAQRLVLGRFAAWALLVSAFGIRHSPFVIGGEPASSP